ncbi:hypothetical protein MRX96_004467 [Rhipicephalus microplus]
MHGAVWPLLAEEAKAGEKRGTVRTLPAFAKESYSVSPRETPWRVGWGGVRRRQVTPGHATAGTFEKRACRPHVTWGCSASIRCRTPRWALDEHRRKSGETRLLTQGVRKESETENLNNETTKEKK